MKNRPDWSEYFLGIATAVAARADCTRRKVGAVIVDKEHRIVGTGYNGAPSGESGCLSAGACPRGRLSQDEQASGSGDYDHCIAIHSESNALLHSDPIRRAGGVLYCTDEPCAGCLKLLKGSGLSYAVWPGGYINLRPGSVRLSWI